MNYFYGNLLITNLNLLSIKYMALKHSLLVFFLFLCLFVFRGISRDTGEDPGEVRPNLLKGTRAFKRFFKRRNYQLRGQTCCYGILSLPFLQLCFCGHLIIRLVSNQIFPRSLVWNRFWSTSCPIPPPPSPSPFPFPHPPSQLASALDSRPCCFLRPQTLLHTVSPDPGVLIGSGYIITHAQLSA